MAASARDAAEALGLHEAVLLLAVDDAEGTVDPRTSRWDEAVAAGVLGELVLRGHLSLDEARGGLLAAIAGPPPDDPLLSKALSRIRRFRKTGTIAWWTDRLGVASLCLATADGLVGRGVLSVRRRGGIPLFEPKLYPTRDAAPESALRSRLRRASSARKADDRTAALLALVVAGDLLAGVFPSDDAETRRRIRHAIRSRPIGRAIVDGVAALFHARAASADAVAEARVASMRPIWNARMLFPWWHQLLWHPPR